MTATERFIDQLHGDPRPDALRHVSGSIRFDLRHDGGITRYLVTIDDGHLSVSRRNGAADCVARMDAETFEALASGRANAMTSFLRGDIEIEGPSALMLAFQRLFPGPRSTSEPALASGGHR
jgi:predicted lipid carrier protein YhbT